MLINVDEVQPEDQDPAAGWKISQFRMMVSAPQGSKASLFHGTFLPGSEHSAHSHSNSDELSIYLRGRAYAGTGDDRLIIGPGYLRVMPKGVPHFLHNLSDEDTVELIGIYSLSDSVEATGYVFHGYPTEDDFAACAAGTAGEGVFPIAIVDTATPYPAPAQVGWYGSDYRELLAAPSDAGAFAFAAHVAPSGGRETHILDNVDTFYYVRSGEGSGTEDGKPVSLRERDVWYVPRGVQCSLDNSSDSHTLEILGFHIGAKSTADIGYRVAV